MTVKELMDELAKLPADRRVVVQGYEDGFDDVSVIFCSMNRFYLKRSFHDQSPIAGLDM